MVYIQTSEDRERNKRIEAYLRQKEAEKPKPAPRNMNLYHMQQIVNKAKRGEKL